MKYVSIADSRAGKPKSKKSTAKPKPVRKRAAKKASANPKPTPDTSVVQAASTTPTDGDPVALKSEEG